MKAKTLTSIFISMILLIGLSGCGQDADSYIEDNELEGAEESMEAEVGKVESEAAVETTTKAEPEVKDKPASHASVEASLEARYLSLVEAYDGLQVSLSKMSGDTQGLSRDAMVDLAGEKDDLNKLRVRFQGVSDENWVMIKVQYEGKLNSFESSYLSVKNKYRVE